MKEFTLQELTEIFVFGLGGGPNVDFRTDLFKRDDGWIQEQSRAFIRRGLTNLFGRGAGIVQGESRTAIGRWIIQQLLNCGLDPNGLRGWDKPYELVRAFQFVKYSADGQPEELTRESIWAIDDDVPIRLICRPLWFRWYGNNRASHLYFGGSAQDQSVFYGNNGRFPMRPGTRGDES